MPITKPTLPPKKGYVEREINGIRQLIDLNAEEKERQTAVLSTIVDQEYRLVLLELGVN